MDWFTAAESDVILQSIVNSFNNVDELRQWALHHHLLGDRIVQNRIMHLQSNSDRDWTMTDEPVPSTSGQQDTTLYAEGSLNEDLHVTSGKQSSASQRAKYRGEYSCEHCHQTFATNFNLKRHLKRKHLLVFECKVCGQQFTSEQRLRRHVSKCGVCILCAQQFASTHELEQHLSSHKNVESYSCFDCGMKYYSLRALYTHREIAHQPNTGRAAMDGAGEDMMDWDGVPPREERTEVDWDGAPPWVNLDGTVDIQLKKEYDLNRNHIYRNHRIRNYKSVYNFPTNDLQGGLGELMEQLEQIYSKQDTVFKVNISLGLILRRVDAGDSDDDDVYRYFIPFDNSTLFSYPLVVSNKHDLKKIHRRLSKLDFEAYIKAQRPNTKWKPYLITNTCITVYKTSFPLGNGCLPDFIKNNRFIISLDADRSRILYKDSLCIFRCLAVHRSRDNFARSNLVHQYHHQW